MSERIEAIAARLGIDREKLRAKYSEERARRIRSDHSAQYRPVGDDFAELLEDPFVERGYTREPVREEVEVAIIGAGFGGILSGVRLRQAGIEDIRIIDEAADFGGTWYWNRYPGAQCDIESYCYVPLLEEIGYMPKERYSYASEIFDVCRKIAEEFDLYRGAHFQTQVTRVEWDEDSARWVIATNHGDAIRARFVITATGGMHRAKLPGIPGVEEFEGKIFHTSRWDYGYTGGSAAGNLDKLGDKKVGVIGTGCTAIQCVPYLAESAEQLYVFQRTPASVDVRGNAPTDPEWVASLEPGWQERRRRNFDDALFFRPVEEVLVNDGWTAHVRGLRELFSELRDPPLSAAEFAALHEIVDLEYNEGVRSRVEDTVEDPDTREKLKAWYRQFCKRPTFNDDYLPTFNRPNVTLVDTSETRGVERITKTGIHTGGEDYDLDCLILATGFDLGSPFEQLKGFDLVGENGLSMTAVRAEQPRTLHGIMTRGFPNMFSVTFGNQGPLGVNFTAILDDQARHVAYLLGTAVEGAFRKMQPTQQAEAEWVRIVDGASTRAPGKFASRCTPSYYNNEGNPEGGMRLAIYPGGVNEFSELLEKWRTAGDLAGMEIDRFP